MPNYKIINSETEPLYTQSTAITYAASSSQQGQVYTVNTSPQTVAASSFLTVQITNPSSSTRTVYVNTIFGGSTATINLSVLRNGSFAAAGTAVTPRNNNWAFADNSSCSSKYIITGSDPTSGGTLLESLYQNNGNFYIPYAGQLIIPPRATNRFLCIRVENPSILTATVALVGVSWWEI
jgi:hypothetical protein